MIRSCFLFVTMICLLMTGREYYISARHRQQRDAIKEKAGQSENSDFDGAEAADIPGAAEDDTEHVREPYGSPAESDEHVREPYGSPAENSENMPQGDRVEPAGDDPGGQTGEPRSAMLRKYAALKRENNHFAGWLYIDGTGIDYPVMQCEDDEYYLHHDFYGTESKYGCLYVRERADLAEGTNFVIYGHNMRDGAMFGNLDRYLDEHFFRDHPLISFDTLYEERVYEIVAVFRSQVYRADDDVFKYYQFYQADTLEEFEDFYTNIKALSIYDTGVEAEFGDTFLTCSTCAYHVEDGRFVVVAKRVE